MIHFSRKEKLFLILAGFFITNALVAELIGGKLIQIGPFTQSIGILPWPIVFLATDITNEYFGKHAVRLLTFVTVALIGYTFLLLFAAMQIPAVKISPITNQSFNEVFGTGMFMIVGSITAFMISQLVDVIVFWLIRAKTGKKLLWLRATGSTLVSQLVDTFVVQFIAFVIPDVWTISEFFMNASFGYVFKVFVAFSLIPFIYVAHYFVEKYLHPIRQ